MNPDATKATHDPAGIAQANPNTVRVAPLQGIAALLSSFGLSAETLLREVGQPADALADPESAIRVRTAARLLALCAERSGRPEFGLLAGQRAAPATLGLIGLLALNSATVGSALRGLVLTLHLNGRAVVPALVVREDIAIFSLALFDAYPEGSRETSDFAIALACNVMRALCGAQWAPSEVLFAHAPPSDRKPYSRFFRAPLRFDSDRTALVFPSKWLEHRVAGANVGIRKALQQGIAGLMSQQDLDLQTRVRRALFAALIQGDVSVETVARMLAMHRRTLNRRLAEAGTTLAAMTNDVRYLMARRLLTDTGLSLVDISAALKYRAPSVFTRAFRSWSGVTPSEWRRRHAA